MTKLSKFHDAKRFLAEQIAACVLIEPALESQCGKLDREQIDPALRSLLAIASYTIDPVLMSKRVIKQLGVRYWYRLITLVDQLDHRGNFAFVVDFEIYLENLASLITRETERVTLERKIDEVRSRTRQEMSTIIGRY